MPDTKKDILSIIDNECVCITPKADYDDQVHYNYALWYSGGKLQGYVMKEDEYERIASCMPLSCAPSYREFVLGDSDKYETIEEVVIQIANDRHKELLEAEKKPS